MANVIRYKTSQPTKRGLRKGNTVIGTGEENYGPTSTTGYVNGITPPDGGYVVYILSAANNPAIYVAETDEDLVDIARTLGGGDLTPLESKNYLNSRSNTWVLGSVPNNKVTDGLIASISSQNKTSFIDNQPTENLATLDLSNTSVWFNEQSSTTTKELQPGTLFGYPIYKFASKPGSIWITPIAFNGYNKANGPITLSAYIRNMGSVATVSTYLSGDYSYDSLGNANYKTIPTDGVWRRYSWTRTEADMNTANQLEFRTSGDNMQISCPQVEHGLYPTPIGEGTRSQNTTVYDLSGEGNNGTLQNGTVFNNGVWELDGVNDRVDIADPGYPSSGTDPFSIEILFKVPTGAVWYNQGSGTGIIGRGSYAGSLGIFRNSTEGQVNFWARLNGGNIYNPGVYGLARDIYHRVVGTFDGSDTAKIYHNGEYIAQEVNANNAGTFDAGSYLIGGGTAFGGNNGGYGGVHIAEAKIYNKALSISEVSQNYYGGPIVTDGLVFATDAGNLVSYESGSTTAYSMTGSLSGSLVNGVGYSSNNGGVWDFDGSNDYITQGPSSELDTNIFSVEAFAKLDAFDNNHRTIMSRNASVYTHTNGWWFGTLRNGLGSGNNDLRFFMWGDSGYIVFNEIGANDGKYHHVVITCDGVKGYFYIDGELKYSANKPSGNLYNSSTAMTIGSSPNGDYWSGNIPIARFYNKALTSDEVLQNFNAQKTRFGL